MSEIRRRTPANDHNTVPPRIARSQAKRRQLNILLITMAVIITLAIGFVVLYQFLMAPYQRVVLKVDDTVVRMDYFLRRARLSGDDIDATLQQLTYEQIVKIESEKLELTVTDLEMDKALLEAAVSENVTAENLKNPAFKTWYSEQLKSTDLTSVQYRERIRVNLMAKKIQEAITATISDTAEQVHLNAIILGTTNDAERAKARLEAGESFASVAQAMSLDTNSSSAGGDWGWVPKGILTTFDDTIFSLEIGQVSKIMSESSSSTTYYYIFMVSEKDPARAMDENVKMTLGYNGFLGWLESQIEEHKIEYPMSSDTRAWVTWQLAKN
jgi:parvulin-like peptidyl-prolyl isomerase